MNISGYRFTQDWQGEHFVFDQKGQIFLRLPSNICVAFTLSFMLFFFLRRKDLFSSIVSLLLTLSAYMTWAYWPEARPYALWYSLSIIHGLLILNAFEKKDSDNITPLLLTHWLLALTSVISAAQILLAGILLLFKDRNFKKTFLLITPIPVVLFYTSMGMSIAPRLDISPITLMSAAAPPEWLAAISIGIIFFLFHKKILTESTVLFTALFLGMFAGASSILLLALFRQAPPSAPVLYYRHFIFLTPYAMLLTTCMLKHLWKYYQHSHWAKLNIILFTCGLLITNGLRTATLLYEHIIFIF